MSDGVEPDVVIVDEATTTPRPSRNHGARRRAAKAAAALERLGPDRGQRELIVQYGHRLAGLGIVAAKYEPRA